MQLRSENLDKTYNRVFFSILIGLAAIAGAGSYFVMSL